MNIKNLFPIFSNYPTEMPLAYLDSAASAQKPYTVLDAIKQFYSSDYANIHRGAYSLSIKSTEKYEAVRLKAAKFLDSESTESIVFTRNATEGFNLIAHGIEPLVCEGDLILLSLLEHHSNIVPWFMLAKRRKLRVEFIDINPDASINYSDFENKLKLKPKIVSLTQHSNAFGTVLPVKKMIAEARKAGAYTVVDAAQSIAHQRISVRDLDTDFLVFSGHKLYGPSGAGVLYGRKSILEKMQPFLGGGDMISDVTTNGFEPAGLPNKFEAGTPAIAEVVGLGAAIDFVSEIGFEFIEKHDRELTRIGREILKSHSDIELYGTGSDDQQGILPFNLKNIHPHDFSTVADTLNVHFRAGFHCAMPALKKLGLSSTARISFGVYSTESDLLRLDEAIKKAKKIFKL
jgi:cysteine desulfurase/selenocysteine lyase